MTSPNIPFRGGRTVYPVELGVHLRRQWIYDPDYALWQDQYVYEKLERDPVIQAAVRQRCHMVAGSRYRVMPASDDAADVALAGVMEALLARVENFAEARFELSRAFLTGTQWQRMVGETERLAVAGAPGRWWVVRALRDVDKQRFRLARSIGGAAGEFEWEIYASADSRWVPVNRAWYIKHTFNDVENRLRFGKGLAEALYYNLWAKQVVIEKGLDFLDRWAEGIVTVGIEGQRDAAVGDTNATHATDWVNAWRKMRSQHVLVHDKSDEVRVENAPAGGWSAAQEALRYFDESNTRLILGSLRPTGAQGETGSFAQASVEQDSTAALVRFDRHLLGEVTLTRDLLGMLQRANRINLMDRGLWRAQLPRIVLDDERPEAPDARRAALQSALSMGLAVRRDEAYEALGFTQPQPTDAVVTGAQPAAQAFFRERVHAT